MLLEKIKQDKKESFKNKDMIKSNLIITIYSEILNKEKSDGEVSDEEILKIFKSFKKGIVQNIEILKKKQFQVADQIQQYEKELEILNEYLPQQYTESVLENIISIIYHLGIYNFGDIMKELKQNHYGLYDGKMASELVKRILEKRDE